MPSANREDRENFSFCDGMFSSSCLLQEIYRATNRLSTSSPSTCGTAINDMLRQPEWQPTPIVDVNRRNGMRRDGWFIAL